MKVILTEDVSNLGQIGDRVKVADGYARNYLLPKGLAVEENLKNAKELEHKIRQIEVKAARMKKGATELKATLEKLSVTIPVTVGEEDKLYGSVTSRDIYAALVEKGQQIDRKKIVLAEPIKALGVYSVNIKLHSDVTATVKVWVVNENKEAKEAAKEAKAAKAARDAAKTESDDKE